MKLAALIPLACCVFTVRGGYLNAYNAGGYSVPAAGPAYNTYAPSYSGGLVSGGQYGGVALSGGAVQSAAPPAPTVHEIHSNGGQNFVRVEEYRQPRQVVRVHEAPRAPAQVVRVQAPPQQASVVRLIHRHAGPPHIERVVFQPPHVQVVNVQRPQRAPERIVQIVRGPSTQPRVVYHREQVNAPQVVVRRVVASQPAFVAAPTAVVAAPTAVVSAPAGALVAPAATYVHGHGAAVVSAPAYHHHRLSSSSRKS